MQQYNIGDFVKVENGVAQVVDFKDDLKLYECLILLTGIDTHPIRCWYFNNHLHHVLTKEESEKHAAIFLQYALES